MKAFFGLLILMGIHDLPREEMYWSTDDRLGVPGISKVPYILLLFFFFFRFKL
jgi:hypothetical protein